MNSTQKIIKIVAIGLAVMLIVNIFSGIFYALSWVTDYFMKETISEGTTTFKENYEEINEIDIEATTSNIVIQSGNKFTVETKNLKSNFSSKVRNQILKIEEDNNWFQKKEERGKIIITVPQNTKLNKLSINTGAGKFEINNIQVQEVELDHGTGDLEVYNSTFYETDIDAGVGEIYIRNSTLNHVDLDAGVGKIDMEAKITGTSQIECGIGSIELTLIGTDDDYTINTEKGIGSITINDQEQKNNMTYGTGANILTLEGGIGSINVYFKPEE